MLTNRLGPWHRGMASNKEDPINANAAYIGHFDIFADQNKLIPMPTFESQDGTGNVARNYAFKAIGGNSTKMYATGLALDNWYGENWAHRIKVTPDAAYYNSTSVGFTVIDLSQMDSATFWTNVKSNGGDIRVTSDDGVSQKAVAVAEFDQSAETGLLYIDGNINAAGYYIYYGNAGVNQPSSTNVYGRAEVFDSYEAVFTFHDEPGHQQYELSDNDNSLYDLTDNGTYVAATGALGSGHGGGQLTGEFGPNLSSSGGIGMLINADSITTTETIVDIHGSEIQMYIYVSGGQKYLRLVTDNSGGNNNTITGTVALSAGFNWVQWMWNGDNNYLYVNKTADTTTDHNDGNVSYDSGQYSIDAGGGVIQLAILTRTQFDITYAETFHDMFLDNTNFWGTIGAEEDYSAITPSYSGFRLWEKDHGETDWVASTDSSGLILQNLTLAACKGVIVLDGNDVYFPCSDQGGNGGNFRVGVFDGASTFEPEADTLETFDERYPIFRRGSDGNVYFNSMFKILYKMTDQGVVSTQFTHANNIHNHEIFKTYHAIVGEREFRNQVELFDYANGDPAGVLNFGDGEVRVLGTIQGSGTERLIAISDRFLDDTRADRSKGFMVVLDSTGGHAREVIKLEAGARYTLQDVHDLVVQPFSFIQDNRVKFYAKFQHTSGEYWEGIWEVGIAPDGSTALTHLLDTSSLGRVHTFAIEAQHYYMLHGDSGAVSRLADSDTFGQTSVVESMAFGLRSESGASLSGKRKHLEEIHINTDPLPTGASVTVKIRKDGATAWTTVGTFDTVGGTHKKFYNIVSTRSPLPEYRTIEVRLESEGGAVICDESKIISEVLE